MKFLLHQIMKDDMVSDALPTPQRVQMWAQVRKQRKKEELEHVS
jgi:hypothetical protein